ncbi:diguanylate cyclase domain-containing protein [Pokkaliibacter sp. CJK22405]|uniref:GGDEF domain-containing protein n=1 Tax=Pokkaliibacter sp. CJK22405 TaxID=3384615 RepID=UPI0039855227
MATASSTTHASLAAAESHLLLDHCYLPARRWLLLSLGALTLLGTLILLIAFTPHRFMLLPASGFLLLSAAAGAYLTYRDNGAVLSRSALCLIAALYPLSLYWMLRSLLPGPPLWLEASLQGMMIVLLSLVAGYWRLSLTLLAFDLPLATVCLWQREAEMTLIALFALVSATAIALMMTGLQEMLAGRYLRARGIAGISPTDFKDSLPNQRQWQSRLQHAEEHDPLTGLFNRYYCLDYLRKQLQRHRQLSDRHLSTLLPAELADSDKVSGPTDLSRHQLGLVMLSLDEFKPLNERYGFQMGDALLQQLSERLSFLNPAPYVSARLDGDTFVMVRQSKQPEEFRLWLNQVEQTLQQPYLLTQQGKSLSLRVGLSVGVVLAPQDGYHADHLLSLAEHRMFRAKLHLTSPSTGDTA